MSMEIALPEGHIAVASTVTDDAFQSVANSSSFLPRLQLGGSSSAVVQEGKVPIGHFYVADRDDVAPLGSEIHVINYMMRLKALDMRDPKAIKAYYDPKDPMFTAVQAVAAIKIKGQKPKALCGAEFLIWVPTLKLFTTFYLANTTLLNEAKKLRALLLKGVTLKSELKSNDEFKWHGMVTVECSLKLDQPPMAELSSQMKMFDQSKPEVVKDPEPISDTPAEAEARPQ